MNVVLWFSLLAACMGMVMGGPVGAATCFLLVYGFGWVIFKIFGVK